MQEMGESGEGSLEPGDSSGEVFAMMYPQPFVLHYYKTFPSKLPAHMQPQSPGVKSPGMISVNNNNNNQQTVLHPHRGGHRGGRGQGGP